MREAKIGWTTPWKEGSRNNNWLGKNVGYKGLHKRIYKKLGKPKKCQNCGKDGLTGLQIHWANISGKYLHKLSDWIRLCALCHKQYDLGKLQLKVNNK